MTRRTDTRIACSTPTRKLLQSLKRGGETYDQLLRKMAAQYHPGAEGLRVVVDFDALEGEDGIFIGFEDGSGEPVDIGGWRRRGNGNLHELVLAPEPEPYDDEPEAGGEDEDEGER